jgi:hypothetical protein
MKTKPNQSQLPEIGLGELGFGVSAFWCFDVFVFLSFCVSLRPRVFIE